MLEGFTESHAQVSSKVGPFGHVKAHHPDDGVDGGGLGDHWGLGFCRGTSLLLIVCFFMGVLQVSEELEQSKVLVGVKIDCELDHDERKARGRQEGSNLSGFGKSEAWVSSGPDSQKRGDPQQPVQTRNLLGNRFRN